MTNGNLNTDVRGRGFRSRISVDDAVRRLDELAELCQSARAPSTSTIDLNRAAGRVLAEEIISPENVPAFDRSAMDGFAAKAADLVGASVYNPVLLKLTGHAATARPTTTPVVFGTTVAVTTGAPIPTGADCVVPCEMTRPGTEDDSVEVTETIPAGRHISRLGEDIRNGRTLYQPGHRLRIPDIGLLASLGLTQLTVTDKPLVQIVITGDEVVAPDQPRGEYQVRDANSPMLEQLTARDGGQCLPVLYPADTPEALRMLLEQTEADVILLSGGSSVGPEDYAPVILGELGDISCHGIAMRPSSPAGFGRIAHKAVFLLPGNPVSCLCAYEFFAGRLIRRLSGRPSAWPHRRQTLPTAEPIRSAVGRTDYCRVIIRDNQVCPVAVSGASRLSSAARADGFLIIDEASEGYPVGTPVCVYAYD